MEIPIHRIFEQVSNLVVFFAISVFPSNILAQKAAVALWKDVPASALRAESGVRLIVPNKARTLRLDLTGMTALLFTAPAESALGTPREGLEISLPTPDGNFKRYKVWNSPIMAPELAAQFPEIRTYGGYEIGNEASLIRLDVTPRGFHAMTYGDGSSVFIDPYATGNTKDYLVYHKKDFVKKEADRIKCHVSGEEITVQKTTHGQHSRVGTCGTRREYRLALAATAEYTAFHGGTVALALAAMNTTMNRVNGVFEKEVAVRMILVANNSSLIYTNAATDPYTNGNDGAMIGQNQANCDAVIGNANYDIGHVFGTNSGGLASLGVVCNNSFKGRGITGSGAPIGDPFDIDYVAHEMGHQFNATHTQYNNCYRENATAVEPGSASTIMGYAGICSPDVQSNSDDYFSTASLFQMRPYVATGTGSTCGTAVAVSNSAPSVTPPGNYNIPTATPFVLTASATDPEGTLTYCWEQTDAYTNPAQTMPPAATNTTGPMFRSLDPVSIPSRYFPNLPDLFNNVNPTWEELPSVARNLNFRVTVRDNFPNAGCTGEASTTVATIAGTGPFAVTSPNTAVTYGGNSAQTVTWNVAGTTAAPINCANVNILLTTNSGATFTTLLANTPNDGSQSVIVPNVTTSTARIWVQCSDNIFFDVSNANFNINTVVCTPPSISDQPDAVTVCSGSATSFTVAASGTGTLSYQWQENSANLSNGGVYSNVTTATLNISNVAGLNGKRYQVIITNDNGTPGNAGDDCSVISTEVALTVLANAGTISGTTTICTGATTQLSSNGASGGTWSSSNMAAATVNASGLVSGVSGGVSVIGYTVTDGACTSTATAAVTINVLPNAAIAVAENSAFYNVSATDGILCSGPALPNPSATLTASGGGTYAWSNGATTSSITVGAANTYTVVVTNAAGCQSTVTQTISVNAAPNTGTISAAPLVHSFFGFGVCANSTITLSSTVPGGVWVAAPKPQPVISIDQTGLVMPLFSSPSVDTNSVFYRVTLNGCRNSIRTQIEVQEAPNAGTISGNMTICAGATTQLSSNGTTASNTIRTWSSSNPAAATVDAASGLVTGVVGGTTTITYSVTDFAGTITSSSVICTSTTSTMITVNAAPNAGAITGTTAVCAGATTQLSSNGSPGGTWNSSNMTAATVNASSGLVSGVASGMATITYTVTDNNGCTASTSTSVTVNGLPNAGTISGNTTVCAEATTQLSSDGASGGTWSSSNTATATVNASSGLVSGVANGTTTITYTTTDNNGCSSSTAILVTVNGAPAFTACPGNHSVFTPINSCTAAVDYAVVASGTPTPTLIYQFIGATTGNGSGTGAGSIFNRGTTAVTVSATNICATSVCQFNVTVVDNQPPVLTCPADMVQPNSPDQCGRTVGYGHSLSDNCAAPVLTYTMSGAVTGSGAGSGSSTYFPVGTTTVVLNATDGTNAVQCSFMVTINDTQLPAITCPASVSVSNTPGQCGATVSYDTPTASDNCSGVGLDHLSGGLSGSFFEVGTTTVQWMATDAANNTKTCTFTVTVSDVQLPGIICPPQQSRNTDPGACTALTTYPAPTVSDNCTATLPTVAYSFSGATTTAGYLAGTGSGSTFNKGITTVTLRATDIGGLTRSCTFRVIVTDVQPPVITCPVNQTVNTADASCTSAAVTYATPTATDNCAPAPTLTRISGPGSGSAFPAGTTNVVWRATDGAGRTATCSFAVTVTDNTPPVINCPGSVSVFGTGTPCGVNVTYPVPTASDNCGTPAVFLQSGVVSGSNFPAGTTVNVFRATDARGTTATCSFSVTVTCSGAANKGAADRGAAKDAVAIFDFTLSPNPAQQQVLVSLTALPETTGEMQLLVFDAQGRLYQQQALTAGTQSVLLSVETWPSGLYWISVQTGATKATKRLAVQRL